MRANPEAADWFGFIKPSEVETKPDVLDSSIAALCDEFSDIFTEPGKPVRRELDHRIDLLDESAKPPRQRQYRLSQVELAEV